MKKLLVLSLVLAVAGLANAVYTTAYVDGKVVVSNDAGLIGGINIGIGLMGDDMIGQIALRQMGAPVSAAEITALGNVVEPYNDFVAVLWGDPVTTPNAAGEWLNFGLGKNYVLGTAENFAVQIDIIDSSTGEMAAPLYLAVPEPMTMGLLGLGALFLRKRK